MAAVFNVFFYSMRVAHIKVVKCAWKNAICNNLSAIPKKKPVTSAALLALLQ